MRAGAPPTSCASATATPPLTHFAAVDWACIEAIPPLAEPARLPPGGGTAVLNLIAALAADQGRTRLPYAGPTRPSSSSRRCSKPSAGSRTRPRTIRWPPSWPAASPGRRRPFRRAFAPRRRLCAVTRAHREGRLARPHLSPRRLAGRRPPRRPPRSRRRRPRAVLAVGAGRRLEDHLVLTPEGDVRRPRTSRSPTAPRRRRAPTSPPDSWPSSPRRSAPPLAAAIRAEAADLAFAWAPLPGDLAVVTPRARASVPRGAGRAPRARDRRRAAGSSRCGSASPRSPSWRRALGDALRARAQVRLAAEPPPRKRARCAPRRRPRRPRRMHGRSGERSRHCWRPRLRSRERDAEA